ncbi:MAG: tetratricopeptide repeat protein, partial [Terracidiphilus sp.]
MRRVFLVAVAVACFLAASLRLQAQSGAGGDAQNQSAPKAPQPAADASKPGGSAPAESNPFPEDTNSVPVLPTALSVPVLPTALSAPAAAPDATDYRNVRLPGEDSDPVRSPDDVSGPASAEDSGSSSSAQGLDQLLKLPPETGKEKSRKEEPAPVVGPKEDINVGSYYLQTKNWKGALSRFQSALVMAPDDPEVYWGLAEAERNLGEFAAAKANYLKVMEYDPDSRHAKGARKILKQPEMANAPAAAPS